MASRRVPSETSQPRASSAKYTRFATALQKPRLAPGNVSSPASPESYSASGSDHRSPSTPPTRGATADVKSNSAPRSHRRSPPARAATRRLGFSRPSSPVARTTGRVSPAAAAREAHRARLASLAPLLMPEGHAESSSTSPPDGLGSVGLSDSGGSAVDATTLDDGPIDATRVRGGGRSAPRSRNGCWTCRTKKVKCDEKRPRCLRCIRLRLFCDYEPRDRRPTGSGKAAAAQTASLELYDAAAAASSSQALLTSQPWLLRLPPWRHDLGVPAQLPEFSTAANSLQLTSVDHEAIRYYRTTFAQGQGTKKTDFSVHSVIFTLAERDQLVMRGLLALGNRDMQFRRTGSNEIERTPASWSGLGHYSAALRMMAATIGTGEGKVYIDLDVVLAGMYLMILYEQKYGDPEYWGFKNHLTGAALIIEQRCGDWPEQIQKLSTSKAAPVVPTKNSSLSTTKTPTLSVFAARMMVYMTVLDGFASTFGLGGQISKVMYKILRSYEPDFTLAEAFAKLGRYSDGIYRATWRDKYPAEEQISDIANIHIFSLTQTSCFQRYLLAEAKKMDGEAAQKQLDLIQAAADFTAQKFPEVVEIAAELTQYTEVAEIVAINLRAYMPLYYGGLLELHLLRRKFRPDEMTDEEWQGVAESYVSIIVRLTQQCYMQAGLDGLHLAIYPMYLSLLETQTDTHHKWLMARIKELTSLGPNIEKLHDFVLRYMRVREETGEKLEARKEFESGNSAKFVV